MRTMFGEDFNPGMMGGSVLTGGAATGAPTTGKVADAFLSRVFQMDLALEGVITSSSSSPSFLSAEGCASRAGAPEAARAFAVNGLQRGLTFGLSPVGWPSDASFAGTLASAKVPRRVGLLMMLGTTGSATGGSLLGWVGRRLSLSTSFLVMFSKKPLRVPKFDWRCGIAAAELRIPGLSTCLIASL